MRVFIMQIGFNATKVLESTVFTTRAVVDVTRSNTWQLGTRNYTDAFYREAVHLFYNVAFL